MTTQIMYSVKLDQEVAEMLEEECYGTGRKRNRLINIAIAKYIQMLDTERECMILPNEKSSIRDEFLRANFPGML